MTVGACSGTRLAVGAPFAETGDATSGLGSTAGLDRAGPGDAP